MLNNINFILPLIQQQLNITQIKALQINSKIMIQDLYNNLFFEVDISTNFLTVYNSQPHSKLTVLNTFKNNGIQLI